MYSIRIDETLDGTDGICTIDSEPLYMQCSSDKSTVDPKLFKITFGKYNEKWSMIINYLFILPPKSNNRRLYEIWSGKAFFANFFYEIFHASYINQSCLFDRKNSKYFWIGNKLKPKPQKYYKELTDFEKIDNSNM